MKKLCIIALAICATSNAMTLEKAQQTLTKHVTAQLTDLATKAEAGNLYAASALVEFYKAVKSTKEVEVDEVVYQDLAKRQLIAVNERSSHGYVYVLKPIKEIVQKIQQ